MHPSPPRFCFGRWDEAKLRNNLITCKYFTEKKTSALGKESRAHNKI